MTATPMLCTPSTGASNRTPVTIDTLEGSHIFDLKLDGLRAFAFWDGETLRLVNRNGVDITYQFPEIVADGPLLGKDMLWLDGEIVADDSTFETVATRGKQEQARSIIAMSQSHSCRFLAFDVPDHANAPYVERRSLLEHLSATWGEGRFGITVTSEDPGFLERVAAMGMEGVIAKRKTSVYKFGTRSSDWVKFKNLHRITCVVTGYATGTGSRAHFGAMHLALVDQTSEDMFFPVGRVGTGFTAAQIDDLKARLDRAEVLLVEIECLNRTSGNQLRFPVYKGIRTDVDILACSIDQLETLPVC